MIWIHAGIHAREWIAPATAIYLIHRLLTSREEKIEKLLDETLIYILPVANPDGYDAKDPIQMRLTLYRINLTQ